MPSGRTGGHFQLIAGRLRLQHNFDSSGVFFGGFISLGPVLQLEAVRNQAVGLDKTLLDAADNGGVDLGRQVGADDGQLLAVSDGVPVGGDEIGQNAHLDIAAVVTQAVQALRGALGAAGGFDINVAAQTAGQLHDLLDHIALNGIQHDVGTVLPGAAGTLLADFEADDQLGHLEVGNVAHRGTDSAQTRDDDHIVMPDIGLFQRVHAAGNRLNQNTLLLRKALGQNMLQAGFGQLDILGKTAVGIFFEAEHSAALAHPVFAGAAEMAVAAGHDLLGADIITDGNAGDLALDVHDLAVEFMAGDVEIKVIGGEAPILDSETPVRQILEQLVAKTGLPPFLLGLNWSTTERMSTQQADLLTSELWALRRTVEPAMRKICQTYLALEGLDNRVEIEWDDISLQDITQEAQAALYRAQAEKCLADASQNENS